MREYTLRCCAPICSPPATRFSWRHLRGIGWCGGRAHEVILPLTATRGTAVAAVAARFRCPAHPTRSWAAARASRFLLAKLYARSEPQPDILGEYLPRPALPVGAPSRLVVPPLPRPETSTCGCASLCPARRSPSSAARVSCWADELRRRGLLSPTFSSPPPIRRSAAGVRLRCHAGRRVRLHRRLRRTDHRFAYPARPQPAGSAAAQFASIAVAFTRQVHARHALAVPTHVPVRRHSPLDRAGARRDRPPRPPRQRLGSAARCPRRRRHPLPPGSHAIVALALYRNCCAATEYGTNPTRSSARCCTRTTSEPSASTIRRAHLPALARAAALAYHRTERTTLSSGSRPRCCRRGRRSALSLRTIRSACRSGQLWWRSLSPSAYPGIALLHVELAAAGLRLLATRPRLARFRRYQRPVTAGADSHLFHGAPALAHACRCRRTSSPARTPARWTSSTAPIAADARRRVDAAHARIDAGELPALAEFDTIRGLTGIGATCCCRPSGRRLDLRACARLPGPR